MINRRENDIYYRYPEFSGLESGLKAKSAVLDGEAPSADLRRQVAEYRRTRDLYRNFEPPGVIA